MEENSFETLSYLTPEDQDPSQSEEEDLEETKRESECSLTECLLPDDCVVPLDWKTLKMICLQWKKSVEGKDFQSSVSGSDLSSNSTFTFSSIYFIASAATGTADSVCRNF
ncbi:hypothetical protein J1605_007185 [Eschrichtius robustus]|uniref:Uncharacterized protein n=1 Tax=Eschrichtius robustus TaxID=9764 RepID=A0AB34H1H1_ESCRO|nr:hypothetical protein J1605_007185 [Eschrichtius robustus]